MARKVSIILFTRFSFCIWKKYVFFLKIKLVNLFALFWVFFIFFFFSQKLKNAVCKKIVQVFPLFPLIWMVSSN